MAFFELYRCKKEFSGQGGPARFDGVSPGDSEPARGEPLPPWQVVEVVERWLRGG